MSSGGSEIGYGGPCRGRPTAAVCSFDRRFIQCSQRHVEVMQQKPHFDVFSSRNRKQ